MSEAGRPPGGRAALTGLTLLLSACSGQQSALNPQGPVAGALAGWFWIMVAVAAVILVAVTGLLVLGLLRGRREAAARPLSAQQSRQLVLVAGVALPAVILLGFVVASAGVDRAVAAPPRTALTVEVIGHRWWWEVNYQDAAGNHLARTANEIHVPVGQPVRLELKSADVIHSFWVPNLHGKTDMIPGQTNHSWFQADRAGVYRGQCSEFCGLQHARMAFTVVAEPPAAFTAWLRRQRQPAAPPATPSQALGRMVFLREGCALCHSIRGGEGLALGRVAPDLTHVASRDILAGGTLPNTRGHLAGWILNPQHLKPGTQMPPTRLAGAELTALLDYLQGLE